MATSKGGGGGGKGGSVTPVGGGYNGGYGGGYNGGNQYGTGYYNPQPQLPPTPYNPMMDVYGSSNNVMQPMSGYYNQYPAGGSNYQPYQPPIYEPTPMPSPAPAPNPGTGPRGGQGGNTGLPIGLEPGTDFNNYNMNDIANAVTQSTFGNYQPIYQNNFQQYAAPAPAHQMQMPILDAASNAGFGGYDQNARATMYAPPMFNFGGYY